MKFSYATIDYDPVSLKVSTWNHLLLPLLLLVAEVVIFVVAVVAFVI